MSLNYNVSLSGLTAARNALKVTSNNIANMNTEGYARQKLSLRVSDTITGGGVQGQIGNGVITQKIERIKDDLMMQQVRSQSTRVSYFQTLQSGMSTVESILGELQEGSITNTVQGFFNSWEELSKFPSETSYRESVIGKANELTFKFNAVAEDLRVYRGELDTKIKVDITQANSIIEQIARANKEIQLQNTSDPNALYDKRDYYIDQLSKLGDIRVLPNSKDSKTVDIEMGGMLVVSGREFQKIDGLYNEAEDRWVLAVGNMPMRLNEGSLFANLEVRNEYIPKSTEKIDELANTIINEVNALHENAFALDGSTGHAFFNGTNASTIKLNSAIGSSPDLISISSNAGEKGNSDISRALADLQFDNIMASGRNPIEDWTGFVVSFGQTLNSISDSAEVYENVLVDLQAQKQSVQGVDLDEELSKLMQYEKFYQSNAKVLQVVDKVFSDLLDML